MPVSGTTLLICFTLWRIWSLPIVALCGVPYSALQWRHNERDGVSNHQRLDCLRNRLFRRRSKKTSKLRVTGLCVGNSLVTADFPHQGQYCGNLMAQSWKFVNVMSRYQLFTKPSTEPVLIYNQYDLQNTNKNIILLSMRNWTSHFSYCKYFVRIPLRQKAWCPTFTLTSYDAAMTQFVVLLAADSRCEHRQQNLRGFPGR